MRIDVFLNFDYLKLVAAIESRMFNTYTWIQFYQSTALRIACTLLLFVSLFGVFNYLVGTFVVQRYSQRQEHLQTAKVIEKKKIPRIEIEGFQFSSDGEEELSDAESVTLESVFRNQIQFYKNFNNSSQYVRRDSIVQ